MLEGRDAACLALPFWLQGGLRIPFAMTFVRRVQALPIFSDRRRIMDMSDPARVSVVEITPPGRERVRPRQQAQNPHA
jgi:hypothetical protein